MTHDQIVRRIAEQIAALAPRFPQLRELDLSSAVQGLSIFYSRGVSEVPDPSYRRLLAEYEAAVRAEPYRKRQPPPSPTMPAYRPDGVRRALASDRSDPDRRDARVIARSASPATSQQSVTRTLPAPG